MLKNSNPGLAVAKVFKNGFGLVPVDCFLVEGTTYHPVGENYQAILQTKDGSLKSFWLTAWLKDNLRAQDAQTGDMLAITFLGKRQTPAGMSYNAYSLVVDKAEPLAEIKGD